MIWGTVPKRRERALAAASWFDGGSRPSACDAELAALAATMDVAQDACEALPDDGDMRVRVLDELLRKCTSAVQLERIHRGAKPSLGKRSFWYERLGDDDWRKPLRANAYTKMEELLILVWRPMTKAESKQRQRMDPEYRGMEQERNTEAKHQVTLAILDREIAERAEYDKPENVRMRQRQQCIDSDREEHAKEWLSVCTIFRVVSR